MSRAGAGSTKPSEAGHGLVDHRIRLAEGESDEMGAFGRVVVEHLRRHGGHPDALG